MNRRILAPAARDLADIEAYISADSPQAARAVAARLRKALDLITARPEIGRPTRFANTREWSVPGLPYVIPYRIRANRVEVSTHMAHKSRASRKVVISPVHTPYDGSSKLFTVGLKPLDPARWIEVDEQRDAYLTEKRRLYAELPDKVFLAETGTDDAQREVLDLVTNHLARYHPDLVAGAPDLSAGVAPLKAASLLVQEDLVLMRRGEDGWWLAAASLCFPSSWSLAEKFGKPLQDIHTPVPGFGRGSRTADIITRIFDNLQVAQPVERMNWSLQSGAELYVPLSNAGRIERAERKPSRFPEADVVAGTFIRVERQTLRKLPGSGDILFTIRIHLDAMKLLERHPDRTTLATSFAAQLGALDDAQLDYKGLSTDRDRLVAALRAMAAG